MCHTSHGTLININGDINAVNISDITPWGVLVSIVWSLIKHLVLQHLIIVDVHVCVAFLVGCHQSSHLPRQCDSLECFIHELRTKEELRNMKLACEFLMNFVYNLFF